MSDSRPVGIFDSGIGGLTVAAEVRRQLPAESFIYIGDTARLPYGPKSPDTVRRYAREIFGWLTSQSVKAVVVACNTATAHAIDDLRGLAGTLPVIGVVEPGARAAVAATKSGTVGVIGTAGTIASGAYRRALLAVDSQVRVVEQACPMLVPFVEEGWFNHPAARLVAEEYLAPLHSPSLDTLVLGCTHYPLLKPLLAEVMGPDVQLIDSARETAAELARVLGATGLNAPEGSEAKLRWATTDDVARFQRVSQLFLGGAAERVELVELPPERSVS